MKYISIIGSTGSIGTQTLDIVRSNKDLKVTALAAGTSIDLLEKQAREFQPVIVAVYNEQKAEELKLRLADTNIKVCAGMDGLLEAATQEQCSVVVTAIVGMIGIRPTIAAMKAGKDIALANKETLVTAGHIIMPMAEELGVSIYPVDSEHSAIFQCLQSGKRDDLDSLIITASGGPFRKKTTEELKHVTVEDALNHPNWSMGRKITIDSATLVNKGLEVIEAKWLFGVDFDDIHVVVQPKSVIHSMIQFKDGSVIAQLGTPDMKLPIQYALFYPQHRNLAGERLDFAKLKEITFEEPPVDVLKGLPYAYKAGRIGGSMPTVLNAANEKAVALFLDRKIQFLDIYDIIEDTMNAHKVIENPTLEEVSDVKTAVSEAVTNAIIHGYENEVHNIRIHCKTEGQTLYVEISDQGKGIEDVKQAMEPLFTTRPELDRSGMGFSFMEAFMDLLEVESEVGKGTTVKMAKTIGKGRKLWITQSL